MTHRVVWFDIPVNDLDRAIRFYSAVLDVAIEQEFPGMAVMVHGSDDVSGCLFKSDDASPSTSGVLLYFNVDGRLEAAVAAVGANGGRIEQSPHAIGPFGRRAIVIDCEGNRIALHSGS